MCVYHPLSLFYVCIDWVLGRTVDQGFQEVLFFSEGFTDLDFAYDTVILAETIESIASLHELLSEESEQLGL